MSNDPDDLFGPPLLRHRKALTMLISILKSTTAELHLDASRLTGREAKELREVADDLDDYAEDLKVRLNSRRFP